MAATAAGGGAGGAGMNAGSIPGTPDALARDMALLEGDEFGGMPPEEKRTSYLDVVRETLEKQTKTAMTYRVVVAGELAKDLDRVEYSSYYQKFFKRLQSESELITGILLVFRGSFVHVLEATQKVVYAFIRDIGAHPTFLPKLDPNGPDGQATPPPMPMMAHVRVLLLSDDVPNRFYPFWASRVIDNKDDVSREVDMSLFGDSESLDKLITDVCVGLLTVGSHLSSLNKSELKHAFEEITERYRDLLPHQNLLAELALCADIVSVEEWLAAFEGHMRLTLESELVWPAPKALVV